MFVASDSDHMLGEFRDSFSGAGVEFTRITGDHFLLDLLILELNVAGRPSAFWGFREQREERKSEL